MIEILFGDDGRKAEIDQIDNKGYTTMLVVRPGVCYHAQASITYKDGSTATAKTAATC
jgi:hypothetical protein